MLKSLVGKRGVSPLIATVLLIAFAVALGAVVMNWGRNFSMGSDVRECAAVTIEPQEVNGYKACYGADDEGGYVNFVLKNTGQRDISGVSMWLLGDKGEAFVDIKKSSLPKGMALESLDKSARFNKDMIGSILKIQFIPKVIENGIIDICPSVALKIETIGKC